MSSLERWTVEQVEIDVDELSYLWKKLQGYPTLFSDATRGDIRNWISLVRDPSTYWFKVLEKDELVGLIYFQLLGDDADIHIVFFDRRPSEKKELVKKVCLTVFENIKQLERISANIPAMYFGTCRLAQAVGFKWEGTKRSAVSIGGRRENVHLYGLLRSEAYGLPEEGRQGVRDSRGVYARGTGRSEDRGSSVGRGVSTESR
jgi:RimJ/RimL family protein N-acetyltransferase